MANDSRPGSDDFMARLQAMRDNKPGQAQPPRMSLKERLEAQDQSIQNIGDTPTGSSAAEIRARIQEKFKKKPAAQAPEPAGSTSSASAAPAPEKPFNPQEMLDDLQAGYPPESSLPPVKKDEDEIQSWNAENGGSCPQCDSYNIASVVFCGNCNYMLRKSAQEKVEVVTAYPLKEMKGLAHTFVDKLAQLNIKTTEDLLNKALARSQRPQIIKHSGMSERSLLRLLHQADLCRVPSLNPESAALLDLLAITSLAELRQQQPLALYKKIQQAKIKLNQNGIVFLPTKSQVATWLEEAAALSPLQIS